MRNSSFCFFRLSHLPVKRRGTQAPELLRMFSLPRSCSALRIPLRLIPLPDIHTTTEPNSEKIQEISLCTIRFQKKKFLSMTSLYKERIPFIRVPTLIVVGALINRNPTFHNKIETINSFIIWSFTVKPFLRIRNDFHIYSLTYHNVIKSEANGEHVIFWR